MDSKISPFTTIPAATLRQGSLLQLGNGFGEIFDTRHFFFVNEDGDAVFASERPGKDEIDI